jgi:polyphosphate glucokinase
VVQAVEEGADEDGADGEGGGQGGGSGPVDGEGRWSTPGRVVKVISGTVRGARKNTSFDDRRSGTAAKDATWCGGGEGVRPGFLEPPPHPPVAVGDSAPMKALGIDIGGTGIKGAVVDTKRGRLLTDRLRLLTPQPATPEAVATIVAEVAHHFDWDGPIGCTFPGVVKGGRVHTAANLDKSWIDHEAADTFTAATGCPVTIVNDADAAGEAEARFGAAHGQAGLVIAVTLGTGIGTALVIDGRLVPNSELGHLSLRGGDAEHWAANSVRERLELSWEDWAARVDEYLHLVEDLFWPDLFIIGGGVSKHGDLFLPLLTCRTPVVAAELRNQAGIVGAAMAVNRHVVKHGDAGQAVPDGGHKHKHDKKHKKH